MKINLLYLCLLLSAATGADAKTWMVEADGSGSEATIQLAVDRAAPGDTVSLGPGTYYESVLIDLPLTLRGREGAEQTILSGQGQRRMLEILAGQATRVEGLTFLQGNAGFSSDGGGVRVVGTPIRFQDCIFSENHAASGGAASVTIGHGAFPLLAASASAEFLACTFTENTAEDSGGALFLSGSDALLQECLLAGNQASHGGGAYFQDAGVRVETTVFDNNTASGFGGGMRALGTLSAERCLWVGNQAAQAGGGLALGAQGTGGLTYCTFLSNQAPLGASLSSEGAIEITYSVFGDTDPGALNCVNGTGSCNLRSSGVIGGCVDFQQTTAFSMCPSDPYRFCDQPVIPGCGPVGHLPETCQDPECGDTPVEEGTWGGLKRRFATSGSGRRPPE